MQVPKIFKVVVKMEVEYRTVAKNIEEAMVNVENTELPHGYVENSFEIKSITPIWEYKMDISLGSKEVVEYKTEIHYEVTINGKTVWVSVFNCYGNHIESESEIDIFKGKELLTDEEIEAVIETVEEQD